MRRSYGVLSRRFQGEYLVGAHGSPKTVQLLGSRADHRTLADVVTARKDYDAGTPVRLFSCSTGDSSADGPCFAQRLADALGVEVTAPTKKVWVWPNGDVMIGDEMGDNDGEWVTFKPGGGADGD